MSTVLKKAAFKQKTWQSLNSALREYQIDYAEILSTYYKKDLNFFTRIKLKLKPKNRL